MAQHIVSDPTAKSFGLSVNPVMASLQGRVLACPEILYKADESVVLKMPGSWQIPPRVQLLLAGTTPKAWTAVCLDSSDGPLLDAFLPHFVNRVNRVSGMSLSLATLKHPPPLAPGTRGESLEDTLARFVSPLSAVAPPTLALVVLDGDPSSYGRVKTFLDAAGVVSQCSASHRLSQVSVGFVLLSLFSSDGEAPVLLRRRLPRRRRWRRPRRRWPARPRRQPAGAR